MRRSRKPLHVRRSRLACLRVPPTPGAHKRRMADAEGVVSELKTQQTMARARCRGTPLFHVQLLLDCAAVNLKRLAAHAGEAASGEAAGPAKGKVVALRVASDARTATDPVSERSSITPAVELRPLVAPGPIAWSFSVSLN